MMRRPNIRSAFADLAFAAFAVGGWLLAMGFFCFVLAIALPVIAAIVWSL